MAGILNSSPPSWGLLGQGAAMGGGGILGDPVAALRAYAATLPPGVAAGPVKTAASGPDWGKVGDYLLTKSWPSRMVQAAWGAATLPGDVYAGRVDPNSDEGIARANDLAGLVTLGSGAVPGGGLRAGAGIKRAPSSLPMDEASRMARAKEMGFDTDTTWYHGTGADIDAFDVGMAGKASGSEGQRGIFFSRDPIDANQYAEIASIRDVAAGEVPHAGGVHFRDGVGVVYDGANVVPARVNPGKQKVIDKIPGWNRDGQNFYNTAEFEKIIGDARKRGYDTVLIRNVNEGRGPVDQLVVLNPANIRSTAAAFDPAKAHLPDILAAGGKGGRVAGAAELAGAAERPGIRVYHGSPHDFDKFDMGKIGTGEGAQTYGHGLYFAEREGVAESYRNKLQSSALNWPNQRAQALFEQLPGAVRSRLNDYILQYRPKPQELRKHLERIADGARRHAEYFAETGRTASEYGPDGGAMTAKIAAALAQEKRLPGVEDLGRMYEARLNASPDEFLDWDKPVFKQSDAVKKAVYEAAAAVGEKQIEISRLAKNPAFAEELRKRGIKGIRYLDQGSRGAGEGSRNYVVFDDNIIDILRKYGIAGLIGGAAGAASMLQPGQAEAAEPTLSDILGEALKGRQ